MSTTINNCVFSRSGLLISFILFIGNSKSVAGIKILQMATGISDSHLLFNYRIAAALTDRGHNVTVVVINYAIDKPNAKPPKGVELIFLDYVRDHPAQHQLRDGLRRVAIEHFTFRKWVKAMKPFAVLSRILCENIINNDTFFWDSLPKRGFDLALIHPYSICHFQVINQLQIQFAYVSAGMYTFNYVTHYMNVPNKPAYMPSSLVSYSDIMTFQQRLYNSMLSFYDYFSRLFEVTSYFQSEVIIARSPPDENELPLLDITAKSAGLVLNGEQLLEYARPVGHNVLYTGSLEHGNDHRKPLSKKWLDVIDQRPRGFILFSFGSIFNTKDMPESWKEAFLGAFSKFSDYTIVWRFDGEFPEAKNYSHIHLVNWLPQRDLLGHPKLALFITHGGYNSFLESCQNGKPVLVIPLFFDQLGNAKRAERFGLGVEVLKENLSTESVLDAMNEVISNKRYKKNVEKLSQMLFHKIKSSEEITVDFVERIWRNRNLEKLNRRTENLYFLQFYCVDSILVLLVSKKTDEISP